MQNTVNLLISNMGPNSVDSHLTCEDQMRNDNAINKQ